MKSNKELMLLARTSLKGKWGISILAILAFMVVYGVISVIFSMLSNGRGPLGMSLYTILHIAVLVPLLVGLVKIFLMIAKNGNPQLSSLFSIYRHPVAAICAEILLLIYGALWSILSFIPFFATAAYYLNKFEILFEYVKTKNPKQISVFFDSHPETVFLLLVTSFVGIVILVIILYRYAMTFYILADDSNTSGLQAVKQSVNMMKGKKAQLILLDVRFIGWYLLGILTLGIGFIWIIPYVRVAKAHFYLDIKQGSAAIKS